VQTRFASAVIATSAITGALSGLYAIAEATIGMVGNSVRSIIVTRFAAGAITLAGTSSRIKSTVQTAFATITAVGVATGTSMKVRFHSASITAIGTASRMVSVIRSAIAHVTAVGTAIRTITVIRHAIGQVVTDATAILLKGIKEVFISVDATIGIVAQVARTAILTRLGTAAVGLNSIPKRVLVIIRFVTATVTAAAIINVFRGGAVVVMTRILQLANKSLTLEVSTKLREIKLVQKLIEKLKEVGS
jgi:hypothetical protein